MRAKDELVRVRTAAVTLMSADLRLVKNAATSSSHHVKMDLNKKSSPEKKSVQNLIIDAKWFRKTIN